MELGSLVIVIILVSTLGIAPLQALTAAPHPGCVFSLPAVDLGTLPVISWLHVSLQKRTPHARSTEEA